MGLGGPGSSGPEAQPGGLRLLSMPVQGNLASSPRPTSCQMYEGRPRSRFALALPKPALEGGWAFQALLMRFKTLLTKMVNHSRLSIVSPKRPS